MPKITLEVKVNLENVTNLRPVGDDFRWYLKLKCSNCGEETGKWQYVCIEERLEVPGSRGAANLVEKCKLCSRQNTLEIVAESLGRCVAERSGDFQRLVTFECRGVEPTDFDPRVGWAADATESSTSFADIDLCEREWCDYDEAAQLPVQINEWQHRFVTTR